MKERFWAVVLDEYARASNWSGFCYTWDFKHPKDTRKEQSVLVWAIYPKKKDALADAKFRGSSKVIEVTIKAKK